MNSGLLDLNPIPAKRFAVLYFAATNILLAFGEPASQPALALACAVDLETK